MQAGFVTLQARATVAELRKTRNLPPLLQSLAKEYHLGLVTSTLQTEQACNTVVEDASGSGFSSPITSSIQLKGQTANRAAAKKTNRPG